MKKTLATILTLTLFLGASMAANKKPINPYSLPTPASQLIEKHWPSTMINNAFIDGKEYEALLSDGTLIEFDAKGVWKECKCMDGLPVTIVPGYITRYIVQRYPRHLIIHLEKMKGGYAVEIDSGLKIEFDLRGNVTKVDE